MSLKELLLDVKNVPFDAIEYAIRRKRNNEGYTKQVCQIELEKLLLARGFELTYGAATKTSRVDGYYFIFYGIHFCFDEVCGPEEQPDEDDEDDEDAEPVRYFCAGEYNGMVVEIFSAEEGSPFNFNLRLCLHVRSTYNSAVSIISHLLSAGDSNTEIKEWLIRVLELDS
jgi:hypothetical protein